GGLGVDGRFPWLDRDGVRLGAGLRGAPAAAARRVGSGPLEARQPRLVLGRGTVEVKRLAAPLLLCAALVASACAPPPPNAVYVHVAPPKPLEETRGVAPGTAYVWTPAYYPSDPSTYTSTPHDSR